MKLRVQVGGRSFEVEVLDARARPVVAVVDGERFEVWPEDAGSARAIDRRPAAAGEPAPAAGAARTNGAGPPVPQTAPTAPAASAAPGAVLAPIPGVIVAVAVQPGQEVAAGQELCRLEAMKMENVIRAARAGVIAAVHVAPGKTVRHREPLMEYAP